MQLSKALLILLIFSFSAPAEQLTPATVAAFDHYVSLTEQRMQQEVNCGQFLWIDTLPPAQRGDYHAALRGGRCLPDNYKRLTRGKRFTCRMG